MAELHQKSFVWLIPNDDNRLLDGLELRYEFFSDYQPDESEEVATVLEVLVALSRRCAFLTDEEPALWAWRLIENLELNKCWDPISASKLRDLDDKLETLIWRNYDSDGSGGFFPLAWPAADQRKVELWYQMNAYIEEMPEL